MYINGFHHVRYRSPLNSELPGDDGSGGQSKKPSDDLLKALFESIFNETTSGSQDPAPNIYHAQQNLKHINTVLDIGKYLPPEETRREMTTMGFSSKQIDYVLAKSRTPDVSVDKVMDQFDKIFELHETNDQENLCDDLLAALFSLKKLLSEDLYDSMNFKLVSFLPALSLRFDTEQVQAIKEELLESIGDTEYKTIELDGAPNKSIALVALYFYMKVHAGIKNDAALTISPTQKQEFTDFIMNSIGLCLQTLPWQNQLANGDSTETKLFALASDAQTNKSNILPTVSMIIKSHQELRNQFIDNSRGGILSYLVDQVDLRNPISADNVLNEKSISDQKHQASMELRSLIDPELVPDRRDTWDHPLDSILNEAKNKNKLFFFPTSHGQAPEEERQMVPIDYVVKPSNSVKFQLDLYQRLIKDGFSCIGLDQKAVIPEQVQNELIDAYHGEGRTAQELGSGLKTELNGIFKTLEDFFKDKESSLVTYLKRSGYRFGDQISLDLAKFINFFDSLKMITHNNRVQIDLINEDDRTTKFTQSDSRRIYVFSPLNSSSKILYDDTGGEILSVAQSTYNEYTRSAGSFKSTYLSYMLPNLHHELAQARGWGEYQTVGTHCDKRVKDLMHSDPVYFGKNDVTFDIMPFTLSRSVKFVPDFKLTTVNSDEDQEDLSEMPMVDDHVDSPNESPVLVN